VWSGGAFGVDAAAHRAALDAGAPTVVVFGGGLDRPSPAEHAPLFARVLDAGGAHVAIMDDGAPAGTAGFIARNAVLAACTEATLVVEAGQPSGALSTARAARRFGRPVLVVPHAPWDARGLGCVELLRQGAHLVATPVDLLEALGVTATASPQLSLGLADSASSTSLARAPSRAAARALEPDELAVVSALSADPVHLDVICELTRLAPSRAAAALLTLALDAVVVEEPAGSFRRASSFL
jgi:DNA processing protein